MRAPVIMVSLLVLFFAGDAALAQGFEVGPGGVRAYDGRRGPPPYEDDRGYGDRGYGDRGYGGGQGYGRSRGGGGQVCANENGFCNFRGSAIVRYGARGVYVSREARNGIPCNNQVFGDPTPGVPKACFLD